MSTLRKKIRDIIEFQVAIFFFHFSANAFFSSNELIGFSQYNETSSDRERERERTKNNNSKKNTRTTVKLKT